MLGNDVVDLRDRDADYATYRAGFDARVFGEPERSAIQAGPDSSRIRWRLWSAKEAAYKAARRIDSSTSFSPICFAVDLGDASDPTATVRHGAAHFAVRFHDGRDFIHAVALSLQPVAPSIDRVTTLAIDGVFDAMLIGHARIASATPDRQSVLARAHAAEALAARWEVDPAAIGFERVGRIPEILLAGRPTGVPVSLSHHGDYVAWAVAPAPSRSARRASHCGVEHTSERIAS